MKKLITCVSEWPFSFSVPSIARGSDSAQPAVAANRGLEEGPPQSPPVDDSVRKHAELRRARGATPHWPTSRVGRRGWIGTGAARS